MLTQQLLAQKSLAMIMPDSSSCLVELLGQELYDDYFGEAEGGDSIVDGVSADINIPDNA